MPAVEPGCIIEYRWKRSSGESRRELRSTTVPARHSSSARRLLHQADGLRKPGIGHRYVSWYGRPFRQKTKAVLQSVDERHAGNRGRIAHAP